MKPICSLLALGLFLAPAVACTSSNQSKSDDEKAKVEIFLATEHVPAGLKAGAIVNLHSVSGKVVTRRGQVHYTTNLITKGCEVVSSTPIDKPKDSEQAVKVELRVTIYQSSLIEATKKRLVTVIETTSGRKKETVQKPVTLRLEMPPAEKK